MEDSFGKGSRDRDFKTQPQSFQTKMGPTSPKVSSALGAQKLWSSMDARRKHSKSDAFSN